MSVAEIKKAIGLLRGGTLYPANIREAQELVMASGQRINDIGVALYYAEKGDRDNARKAAGKAADTLARMI